MNIWSRHPKLNMDIFVLINRLFFFLNKKIPSNIFVKRFDIAIQNEVNDYYLLIYF